MSRGFTPRHVQTVGDLGFVLQFKTQLQNTAPISSSLIVPRVTKADLFHSFHVRDLMPNNLLPVVKALPRPTPVPAMMRELHWHHC